MLRQVLHGLSKRKKKQTNKNTSLKTNTRSKKENWRNFQKSISFWNEKTAAANKQQWRTGGRRARCVSQFFFPSTSSIQTWSESTLDSISLLSESILKLRLEEFAPCESGSGIGSESAYQVDLEADCQVDLRNCAASCPMCELWRFIFRALNWISMWFEFCHYRFQFQHGSLSLSLSLSLFSLRIIWLDFLVWNYKQSTVGILSLIERNRIRLFAIELAWIELVQICVDWSRFIGNGNLFPLHCQRHFNSINSISPSDNWQRKTPPPLKWKENWKKNERKTKEKQENVEEFINPIELKTNWGSETNLSIGIGGMRGVGVIQNGGASCWAARQDRAWGLQGARNGDSIASAVGQPGTEKNVQKKHQSIFP